MVEIDGFHKGVLGKAGLCVPSEILHVAFQPDGFAQIKLKADLMDRVENFVRPGIVRVVADHGIL